MSLTGCVWLWTGLKWKITVLKWFKLSVSQSVLSGRGLLDQFDWQQRVVSTVTRCRPAPPSVRCTLWPRRSTRTERREDSLWTGSSNMKTPTWPPPPCNSHTHTHTHTHRCTGVCVCSHVTTALCCVFQCEGRHQQGGSGDSGVLQSQSEAGGLPWRVRHTHTHTHTHCWHHFLSLTVSCRCHR